MPKKVLRSVKALTFRSSGEVLMLRRAEPFPGEDHRLWDIPGGLADPEDPSPASVIERETREETLKTVAVRSNGADGPQFYYGPQEIGLRDGSLLVRHTYLARVVYGSKQPRHSHEHQAAQWMPLQQVAELEEIDPDIQLCLQTERSRAMTEIVAEPGWLAVHSLATLVSLLPPADPPVFRQV